MIHHISIQNFAIIKNTEIEFEEGLNIITGETGSGKSIVVEAINLALGGRADSGFIRHGEEKATIVLAGNLDDEEIVIKREISANGKNICRINGEVVTLGQVQDKSRRLADIHGQYDNQALLNPDNHINLVDRFGGEEISLAKGVYFDVYQVYDKANKSLNRLLSQDRELRRKADFMRYEFNEIEGASLVKGEDSILEDEIRLQQNSEVIFEALEKSYMNLFSMDSSALDKITESAIELDKVSNLTPTLSEVSSELNDIRFNLEALQETLRDLKGQISFEPAQLDKNISRLEEINSLKKKYGSSIEEILEYKEQLSSDIDQLDNFDGNIELLERERDEALKDLIAAGENLTKLRKKVSEKLCHRITSELKELNFADAMIEARFSKSDEISPNGMDSVELFISTNRGEPMKPLVKTASGGEISRIMLAIKKITGSYDSINTMIFDEIDTGISGITASIVGRKLKEMASTHQIICITHLPQIAARSDYSFRIFKESDTDSTYTFVERLDEVGKVNEIARLLGGEIVTETTLSSARELIYGKEK